MSTNSAIGLRKKDGVLRVVYCHWDGYPECTGALLLGHYTSVSKIEKLISGGSISALNAKVDIPKGAVHTFENPSDNVTLFYRRDRGDSLTYTKSSVIKELSEVDWGSYLYIYDELKGTWEFYKRIYTNSSSIWQRLNYNASELISNAVKEYGMLRPRTYK